ncbi:hypothetical protein SAMN05421780_102442 [Flexibacter flexilis DSM 6793]|uniref:Uncharacterized protein n=1 Tax=Flexibacter flexilis DSM 6793 TaxID=927664 RepID=A0A1I1G477_9BACT|nr:hypothetical protein [Flexibacter flexilis]SFC06311.1 hypothetical protein SAMN05421780_102442 [Flexibacter flexilis DSM 6793]
MKNVMWSMALVASICIGAFAQNETPKQQTKSKKMKVKTAKMPVKTQEKSHVCTQACHDEGHCVYVHGEKEHNCTAACKKM